MLTHLDNDPTHKGFHDASQSGTYSVDFSGPGVPGQSGWKWCHRCQTLFYAGNSLTATHCPAYNPNDPNSSPHHDQTGSGDYTLNSGGAAGQSGWRWCTRCQGLFFATGGGGSCPLGGAHTYNPQFANYVVKTSPDPVAGVQIGWSWCQKCQGLFFSGPLHTWNFSQASPAIAIPPPRALDYVSGAQRTFAYAWLFNVNEGGAIAYFGENQVMEDQNGVTFEGYVLNEYVKGGRVLGAIWLNAQRTYYQNFLTTAGGLDYNFTPPRIYLGIMEFFGDPSLRLQ